MTSAAVMLFSATVTAHPIRFNSTMTYSPTAPAAGPVSIANWTGAAFDAANIGGSGVNADGGANNGAANDATTYVANNQPVQGQTIVTGSSPEGYLLDSVTVRMAGYTGNVAAGDNLTAWNLNPQNGPIIVTVGRVNGSELVIESMQNFTAGAAGNPGEGSSANGPGTYITFDLPFTVHLKPNTTYAFDFIIGNGASNYFEWLGISTDPYADGTAYTRSGLTISPLAGDRVFQVNMTEGAPSAFAHPGTLHTQADLDRMKAKIAAAEEPWLSGWNMLLSSPYNNLGWPAYDIDYIIRGVSGSNYTRSQQDAHLIYTQALRWHLTGDTAYADRAVTIANVWSDLIGVTGNSNLSLGAGICGYLFAISGELLSTYPGWPEAEKQAYKDMMMRVFYPANFDFLWRHHDTFWREGGNTHYRLNWDTCNMASMAAIGVLCDNRAVYEQALDFFKYGPGNGRIERAAWYVHPDGSAQTEEIGRDQGHNWGGWYSMALLCQTAWNQGDDLWGYDNNRVLRAMEHTTKWNLWHEVPWAYHRNTLLNYTETLSEAGRGSLGMFHELAYNHYVNIKGLAAPYTQAAAEIVRPERWPNTSYHPSEVDWFGHGTLTFSRDPIAAGAAPSGLYANWSENRIQLNWWGSAYATSYNVKRSTTPGGPYTTIGTVGPMDTTFSDTNVIDGTTYYYVITSLNPDGEKDSYELTVRQALVTRYAFDGNAEDAVGDRDAAPMGGSTGLPGFAAGKIGQAISLDGVDDYVQLPVGVGNYQDITVTAWIYWNGGGNWQRVFDFGTEIEKNMFLTPSTGSNMQFSITTSKGAEGTGRLNGPVMPTGQWTHAAVSLNGDTGTLYVNGKPVDAQIIDAVDPLFGQVYCYLGKSMWNGDPLFNGRIDDFRIYNHALSGDEVWNLWGQSANAAPTFDGNWVRLADATEDAPYSASIAGRAADSDGGPVTFSKVTGPDWVSVAADGAVSGTPTNAAVGEQVVVVRAADSTGATDDASLMINVVNVNDAPTWLADDYILYAAGRGESFQEVLSSHIEDVDGDDALTFSKVSGPDWLTVAADGTISGVPAGGDIGVNDYIILATDLAGAADEVNLKVLVSDLKAYYPFDGDVEDRVWDSDGTAAGDPAYGPGKFGQALMLDGVDDAVTLPAGIADSDDLTVALWINWKGGGDWQRLFDFGNSTDQYLFLTPKTGSVMRFAVKNGGGEQRLETTALPVNQATHLAVTLTGNTGRLYVNGVLRATNTSMTINPADFRPSRNFIGDSQFDSDPLVSGGIDDFRVYNYGLTSAEIADLYNNSVPNHAPQFIGDPVTVPDAASQAPYTGQSLEGTAFDPDGDVLTWSKVDGPAWLVVAADGTLSGTPDSVDAGLNRFVVRVADPSGLASETTLNIRVYGLPLTAYYKFEGNVHDSVGAFDGAAVGSPAYTAGPVGGKAIDLDGADDYVTLPAGIMDTDDMTVAAWFRWDGGNPFQWAWNFGGNTTYYMFLTPRSGDNTLRFAITSSSYGNEQRLNAPQMPTGQWVHVAVTLEGDTGRLYVNGALANTNTAMTLNPSSLNATLNYLGKSQFGGDPLFNGQIDDLRIYHRALSPAAIARLAESRTDTEDLANLALWWLWLIEDCGPEDDCLTADLDGNGVISLSDLAELARQWL